MEFARFGFAETKPERCPRFAATARSKRTGPGLTILNGLGGDRGENDEVT